jgi:hypothetical protein
MTSDWRESPLQVCLIDERVCSSNCAPGSDSRVFASRINTTMPQQFSFALRRFRLSRAEKKVLHCTGATHSSSVHYTATAARVLGGSPTPYWTAVPSCVEGHVRCR